MTPQIDLSDPRTKALIDALHARAAMALNADRRIEDAILPFYSLQKGRLVQTGSCIAFNLGSEHFLLSASHVFDPIDDYSVMLGGGEGERLFQLSGERFSSAKGPSGTHSDDPIDASVFHIQSGTPAKVQSVALGLADLSADGVEDETRYIFGTAGFRCNKTKRKGASSTVKYELFPSAAYGDKEYEALKLDRRYHLALAHDNKVLSSLRWQKSPEPRGFSGGAMIKFTGIPIAPDVPLSVDVRPQLVAVTIAHRRRTNTTPGVLIGTRVGVHMGLIKRYLPELLGANAETVSQLHTRS